MSRITFLLFRFSGFLRFIFFRRFTDAGRMALAGLAATALLGADTYKNVAHQAFSLLFFLFVLAFIASRFGRPRITVHRTLPQIATAGVPFAYTISVASKQERSCSDLVLFEDFGDPRPEFREVSGKRATGERTSFFRSMSGVHAWRTWKKASTAKKQAEPAMIEVGRLRPGAVFEVKAEMLPLRRGYLRYHGVNAMRPDPLGLFRSSVKIQAEQSVLVLPRQYRLQGVRLSGGRKYHQGGVTLASNVGDANEFVSLRDYRSGDPLKQIHWKSWARTGKPVVKEYADEFFTRHALVLDTFAQEEDGVFEEAVSVAASLVANVDLADSLLDLMFVGTEAFCFTTGRSVGHTEKMLEILACARACRDRDFSLLDELVTGRSGIVSSCICVLLAWDGPRQELVRKLRVLGVPVKVLVVREPGGRLPEPGPMKDIPASFHVLETGKIEEGLRDL